MCDFNVFFLCVFLFYSTFTWEATNKQPEPGSLCLSFGELFTYLLNETPSFREGRINTLFYDQIPATKTKDRSGMSVVKIILFFMLRLVQTWLKSIILQLLQFLTSKIFLPSTIRTAQLPGASKIPHRTSTSCNSFTRPGK